MDLASVLLSIALRIAEMQRPRITQSVIVVGTTGAIGTPQAVTTLDAAALSAAPAAAIDDALRSVPGFSLFRRSSSRVANPTTQGATLRGLAASGSSRALVLADGVPLNDPVGGWVYWNRVPAAALDEISVARGASGDLHGADAVGGVITMQTNTRPSARLLVDGGSDETARVSGYGGRTASGNSLFAAVEGFQTDGFVTVAPEIRGVIDTPAGSGHLSAHAGVGVPKRWGFGMFRATHFRESRKNGTPFQRNSTRLSQASAQFAHWGGWSARAYATVQDYEQTFSAVLAGRATERPTSEQNVGASAFGGSADWSIRAGSRVGIAGRHVRADVAETPIAVDGSRGTSNVVVPTQSSVSAFAQTRVGVTDSLMAGAGARLELWQTSLGDTNRHVFFNPRLWLTYSATPRVTLNLALQSGFRGPTLNELYRPFRVGNTVTQANALLKPEGVRGIEAGISRISKRTTVRLLGFFSVVDDAIVNVTLSSTGGTIVRQRQNAASVHARGMEFETDTRVGPTFGERLVITTSTSYTRSDFASGPLEGLRVPQVPKWHHAIGGRGVIGPAKWSAEWRYIDEQFDDDRNVFPLDASSMLDARVGWMVTKKIEVFGAMENVTDEEQDVGRTPVRTIGLPRTSRLGVRVVF